MGDMKSRETIKEYAKQAFNAQRKNCIIAVFLVLLIRNGYSSINRLQSYSAQLESLTGWSAIQFGPIFTLLSIISIPVMLLLIVLTVNLNGVMIKAFYGQPITWSEPFSTLKFNFGRKLGGSLWAGLWVFLWTLLFIVPGIIKAYAYSMTEYILASHPNVLATEAIKLSKRMTKGHKGKLFVLDLSFIGWYLLNILTLGILGIFYVNPYYHLTRAGFFIELRDLAVANGVIQQSELDGISTRYRHSV